MKIRQIMEVRRLELFVAVATVGMGLWLINPMGDGMASPAYFALINIMPEWQWGALFFFNGATHFFSLKINGARWWSPMARMAASGFSILLYMTWAYGFWLASPYSTAVLTYFANGCACMSCYVYAFRDARVSWELANA